VLAAVDRPSAAAEDERVAPELALLIIDMQNDFVSPERPSVRHGSGRPFPEAARTRMLANARAAADGVRARGWPVIHVYTARRTDDLDDVHARGSWREDGFPPGVTHVAEGTWGTAIVAELMPQEGDFLVQKKGASGFGLTHLHRLLRNLRVRRCLLAGGSVTGCVRATMFDGIALGYDLSVLGDATYPPESPHVEFLARWCPVLPTEDALELIARKAATVITGD
jgi:nicotinamidase-related amidase